MGRIFSESLHFVFCASLLVPYLSEVCTDLRENHALYDYRQKDRWGSICALVAAVLLHISVIVVLPDQLMHSQRAAVPEAVEPLEVELLPPEPLTEEELRYVEANPEAPVNEPTRTDRYSFRSQQAADENLSEDELDAPSVDGELEDSLKIVQGAVEPAAVLPAGVYQPPAKQGEGPGTEGGKAGAQPAPPQVAPPEPMPLPAFIQQKPVSEDGPGSRLEDPGEALELTENAVPNAPISVYKPQPAAAEQVDAPVGDGGGGSPDAKPVPRARPQLDPDLTQGPLMRSRGSASRRGTLALDATFSEFGEYEQQFYAALQAGWFQEIEFVQPMDTSTRVIVEFVIKSDGTIHDAKVLDSNASELATLICPSAIMKRSPFRPWTKEMMQVFGNERTLQVGFHYR